MGLTETAIKFDIQDKIEALRKKEQEFKRAGDFGRATHAKIVRVFLEDFLRDASC